MNTQRIRIGCSGCCFTAARLHSIVKQLDPHRCNAVEFRHRSWCNEEVFASLRNTSLLFCSVSAPRLPDDVIEMADAIYIHFHGTKQRYRHDYSEAELETWAKRILGRRANNI